MLSNHFHFQIVDLIDNVDIYFLSVVKMYETATSGVEKGGECSET